MTTTKYLLHDMELGDEEEFDTLEDFKLRLVSKLFQFGEGEDDQDPEYPNYMKQYEEWEQQVDNATADNIVLVANEFLNLFDYDADKYED